MLTKEEKRNRDREVAIAYDKLQEALNMAEIIFCEYDIKNNIFIHRSEFHKNIGIDHEIQTMDEVKADDVTILLEDKHKVMEAIEAVKTGIPRVEIECRVLTKSGYRWHRGIYKCIYDEEGKPESAFICFYDIHERKLKEMELKERVQREPLTGLLNRCSFEEKISGMQTGDKSDSSAFLLIDIDDFKHVNDVYGHSCGDKVLIGIAKNLKKVFGEEALSARMGGDEFAVYISNIADRDELLRLTDDFRGTIADFGHESGRVITCSIGISFTSGPCVSFEKMYKKADEALYISKYLGKDRYFVHGDPVRLLDAEEEEGVVQSNIKKATNEMIDIFLKCAPNSMIFTEDLNTNITRWTAAAVDYFALPGEYIRGFDRIWIQKIHPDDLDRYLDDIMDTQEGRKKTHCCEYRVENKYNEYAWVHCEGRVFHDESKNLHVFMGIMNRIAEPGYEKYIG